MLDFEKPEEDVKVEGEVTPAPEEKPEAPAPDTTPQDEAQPVEADETPAKKDTVPLSKYMGERKKRQELEQRIAAQTAEAEKLRIAATLQQQGFSEEYAKQEADERVSRRRELERIKEKDIERDIRDLAKDDDFYADATDYTDELKEVMREKDVDAKAAYMLLRGDVRRKEVNTQAQQLNLAKRRTVEAKKVDTTSAAPNKDPYPLTQADEKALEGLKASMPEANWTRKKYYERLQELGIIR